MIKAFTSVELITINEVRSVSPTAQVAPGSTYAVPASTPIGLSPLSVRNGFAMSATLTVLEADAVLLEESVQE